MVKKERILAIIPARGGSKRLPYKNIFPIGGRPLISHTIEAAGGCLLIDRVIVSTEDKKIKKVANSLNAEVMDRPHSLATDHVRNDEVMRDILLKLSDSGERYDIVLLLQPTSPLRSSAHINECITQFLGSKYRSAMSVTEATHHPAKAVVFEDESIKPFVNTDLMEEQTQKLEKVYQQNGAIYLTYIEDFLANGRLYQEPCMPYVMSKHQSVDVDTELDMLFADLIMRKKEKGECLKQLT